MQFVVYAEDNPDALSLRLETIDAHRRYLVDAPARHGISILLSGPLTQDDGETMRGSFFLIEAEERETVEKFFDGDPLKSANVWRRFEVSAVHIRQNNMTD
ncbi:YciI family protein [uncultured Roseibium sp.]|uniref:YciI family protein n=1 Tax=uncultured Roseibium sp. TaxID=1936171 RepID=UPI002612EC3C|nr:YciI family protein [uncultured Roseibium sp.]